MFKSQFTHIYSMDETMRSERRILNERWVLEKSVQTVAVPLQSAVQSAFIIREMTTIEFSLNLTLQIHFMFSEYEDQTSVCQFNIVIFNELRGTVINIGLFPKIFCKRDLETHIFDRHKCYPGLPCPENLEVKLSQDFDLNCKELLLFLGASG